MFAENGGPMNATDQAAQDIAALQAENERLREECKELNKDFAWQLRVSGELITRVHALEAAIREIRQQNADSACEIADICNAVIGIDPAELAALDG